MHNHAPAHPPLVSNELLRFFAQPDYAASRGEYDAEALATIAVALPEMARELLSYRPDLTPSAPAATVLRLPQRRPAPDAPARAAIRAADAHSLARACRIIMAPYPVAPATLAIACRTIIALSDDHTQRTAAAETLVDMGLAA